MPDRTADRITNELKSVRSAVSSGDYETLAKKFDRLDKLMSRLSEADVSEESVSRIKKEAMRTEGVLNAAREGMTAAAAQLDALRNGVETRTYSAGGTRSALSAGQKTDHSRRV